MDNSPDQLDEFKVALAQVKRIHGDTVKRANGKVEDLSKTVQRQSEKIAGLELLCEKRMREINRLTSTLDDKCQELDCLKEEQVKHCTEIQKSLANMNASTCIHGTGSSPTLATSNSSSTISTSNLGPTCPTSNWSPTRPTINTRLSDSTSLFQPGSPFLLPQPPKIRAYNQEVDSESVDEQRKKAELVDSSRTLHTAVSTAQPCSRAQISSVPSFKTEDPLSGDHVQTSMSSKPTSLVLKTESAIDESGNLPLVGCQSLSNPNSQPQNLSPVEMYSPSLLGSMTKNNDSPLKFLNDTVFSPSLLNLDARMPEFNLPLHENHFSSPQVADKSVSSTNGVRSGVGSQNGFSGKSFSSSDADSVATSPEFISRSSSTSSRRYLSNRLFSEVPPSDTQVLMEDAESQPSSPEVGSTTIAPSTFVSAASSTVSSNCVANVNGTTLASTASLSHYASNSAAVASKVLASRTESKVSKTKEISLRLAKKAKLKKKQRLHQTTLTQMTSFSVTQDDERNDSKPGADPSAVAEEGSQVQAVQQSSQSCTASAMHTDCAKREDSEMPNLTLSPEKMPKIQKSPIKSLLCRSPVTTVPQTPGLYQQLETELSPRRPPRTRSVPSFDPDETVLSSARPFLKPAFFNDTAFKNPAPSTSRESSTGSRINEAVTSVAVRSYRRGLLSTFAQTKPIANNFTKPGERRKEEVAHVPPKEGESSTSSGSGSDDNPRKRKSGEMGGTSSLSSDQALRTLHPTGHITDNSKQMREKLGLPSYPCVKVVRKKADRNLLFTKECQECASWYGDNPERIPASCRHRRTYQRTDTPMDLFDLAFPATQNSVEDPSTKG